MPRVWDTNFKVYGVRKASNQLNRERINIACSTAARMMTQNRLRGTVRGKGVKITPSYISAPCPQDKVNRQLPCARDKHAVGEQLQVCLDRGWLPLRGFRCRQLANHIVGWRVRIRLNPLHRRLAHTGIYPSVGSGGDSYDNALVETIYKLYKTAVIPHLNIWKNLEAVKMAALEWVECFNNRWRPEPIGNIPHVEAEANYYAQRAALDIVA